MGYLITKFCLKKPVTAFLGMLTIVFFGFVSITTFKYELMPEISMPMYAVATIYPGAQPEDIDTIITKKIEDKVYNLQGVKTMQATSNANLSVVAVQYNYGQNMDKAYNDLKKTVDQIKGDFPDSVQEPTIYEMDISAMPVMSIEVRNINGDDAYNYVKNVLSKEIEKISEVSSVNIIGGRERYIKICLKPEMIARYNLSIDTLKQIISAADFAYPAGTLNVGERQLSFTTSVEYDTLQSLKSIPIITGNKRTLYLEDLADIYMANANTTSLGRYDGTDCIIITINKIQSASTVSLSNHVRKALKTAIDNNPNYEATVVEDDADNINNSISSVFETMIIAIILSMLVIWLFLGGIRASLIIGTSIPFSILTAFVAMKLCGYTLNIITLSALVLGVGMMVDNSIVVLEACFRASDEFKDDKSLMAYCKASLISAKTIGASVFGSTLTTVVVFAPLGFLQGMSGQFFKPLGFTIVFCMFASYVSAISVVPLLYVLIKPTEREGSWGQNFVEGLQDLYRGFMPAVLKLKWLTMIISIVALVGSLCLIPTFETELVASSDQGMIKFEIQTKPGITIEKKKEIYSYFEEFISSKPEIAHYLLSGGASAMSVSTNTSQSIVAYLVDKKDRKESTKELISKWRKELATVTGCTVNLSSYSTSATSQFVMPSKDKCEIYIEADDYKSLKEVNDRIIKKLEFRKDCSDISSSLDNSAPVVKAEIDSILAAAEGFTPALVGAQLNTMLSGVEVMEKKIDDEDIKVKIEFPETEYDTIEKVANIKLTSQAGNETLLKDIAKISYHDSPKSIPQYNKKYKSTIVTYLNEYATETSAEEVKGDLVDSLLTKNVSKASSVLDEMLNEEFTALGIAISASAFLVFVVMASQFESVKFSLMVMGTVLFSVGGGLVALWLADLKLSMCALLGFLILIGTAVNNGILYVDTVNQYIDNGEDLNKALVESGAIRLRPILMTTLTTIVSMIPMALAYGDNGEILQGLAVADIGGLISSTIMALVILPVLYLVFSGKKKSDSNTFKYVARDAVTEIEDEDRKIATENAERRQNERKNRA